MTKQKVLVLGNSNFINYIEFNKLQPNILTFGVNRIWLKYFPNYFFFQDKPILTELNSDIISRSKLVAKSVCFTSDLISNSNIILPNWLRKYPRQNRRPFPDSITTGLSILSNKILPNKLNDYTFYIAGVSLKWEEPSHFWKEIKGCENLNTNDRNHYDIRFAKMMDNFKRLKAHGFNMVSVTPDSNLNKIMRYENISNLYSK